MSDSKIPAVISGFWPDHRLAGFGPLAAAAIPQIELWRESPNEYIRLLAMTTIVKLNPDRTDLLPLIWQATESDHPAVQSFARDFFCESEEFDD